jgi:hypothetical protein
MLPLRPPTYNLAHLHITTCGQHASIISYSDYWKAAVAYTWHLYAAGSCDLSAVATKDRPSENH